MSRRIPTTPAPLARRADGRDKGIFRAERHTAVDVIDPGGHRLVRFVRYLWETGPASCEIDSETINEQSPKSSGNVNVLLGRLVANNVPYRLRKGQYDYTAPGFRDFLLRRDDGRPR